MSASGAYAKPFKNKTFTASLICISSLLSVTGCVPPNREADQRFNIIFLLADDLGYGDVGFNHQERILTPHIDQMARDGLVFTDFYAGSTICGPSRSVLMTGLHTGHTTVRGNMTEVGGNPGLKGERTVYRANLSDEDFTIGQLMQQSGYYTGMVGKWHLGGFDPLATPLQRGFNEFSGWLINHPETYASTYWPDKRFRNGAIVDIVENQNGKKRYYHTSICTDEAMHFLDERKTSDTPFLLMVNYNNPHAPLDAPDHAIYEDREWPEDMKIYASMIHYLDQSVQRILEHLKATGLDRNTIVFFCSDNGPRSNYSEQLTDVVDYFNSNGPLRGYKRDLYEGGIRTPMIAWCPGQVQPGTTSGVPGYFADIMPTLAGLAHSKAPFKTDGIDLSSVIIGTNTEWETRYLYWEFHENGFVQAVRYGKWKAVKRDGVTELYDLESDISEDQDISAQHPDIVRMINEYLSDCRTASPYWPTEESPL